MDLQQVLHYYNNFRWEDAPLTHWSYSTIGALGYLAVIFGGARLMRNRKRIDSAWFDRFALVHNFILFGLSLAFTLGVGFEVIRMYLNTAPQYNALYNTICDPEQKGHIGGLAFWCWFFYASKYYEWIDTVLLVAKKKPLTFLHVFHHFIVPQLFWQFCMTHTTGHWVMVFCNSFVHVFMYWYYAMVILKVPVWWKKYITIIQIIQFIIDLTACYPVVFIRVALGQYCRYEWWNFIFGQTIGVIFLVQFTLFYRKYEQRPKAALTGSDRSSSDSSSSEMKKSQ